MGGWSALPVDKAGLMPPTVPAHNRPLVAPRKVREWARKAGLDVGERGRLREDIVAAYREAVTGRSA